MDVAFLYRNASYWSEKNASVLWTILLFIDKRHKKMLLYRHLFFILSAVYSW